MIGYSDAQMFISQSRRVFNSKRMQSEKLYYVYQLCIKKDNVKGL